MKNYKINQGHTKRNIISVIVIVVVVLIAYTSTSFALKLWPFTQPTLNGSKTDSTSTNGDSSKDNLPPSDGGSTKTTDQIPVDTASSATINTLKQENGSIIFNGSVSPALTGGTCLLTFTNPNDKPITRTSVATTEGASSVCKQITISETEFSYLGTWTATFRYFVGDKQVVATKDIIIK